MIDKENTLAKLYICGTPIGNLEDVSIRLLKTLRKVDLIACEDTRQTIKLLNRYKIKKKLTSYHEHSGINKENALIEALKKGNSIALLSDAGMPLISDPGGELIKKAIEENILIEVIPGPSAFTAALVLSGLDSTAFVFEGFLASKKKKRREKIMELSQEKRTLILYESPHRLIDTLKDMEDIMGSERKVAVARELTKIYEETKRGSLAQIREYYEQNPPRGEISILVEGMKANEDEEVDLEQISQEVQQLQEAGLEKKEALKIKAREYHIKKSDIYNYIICKNKD